MEKLKNLNAVSFFLFMIMAFLYIAMVLGLRNGFLSDLNLALIRILDIPFALIALTYGGSTLALQLSFDKEGNTKHFGWSMGIFMICLLLFSCVVIVNFAFPTQL